MCGAFVLGQVSERLVRVPSERLCERARLSNGLLIPYHLGRLTTYSGLGATAAIFSRLAWLGRFSAVLLAFAALLFLCHALGTSLPFARALDRVPRLWSKEIRLLIGRIGRGSFFGEYLFGVTLGFLPCGLLYAALFAAGATAQPALGAVAMLAFGLGTIPMLIVVGVVGHAAGRRWNRGVAIATPALLAWNAVLLLILAWQRMM